MGYDFYHDGVETYHPTFLTPIWRLLYICRIHSIISNSLQFILFSIRLVILVEQILRLQPIWCKDSGILPCNWGLLTRRRRRGGKGIDFVTPVTFGMVMIVILLISVRVHWNCHPKVGRLRSHCLLLHQIALLSKLKTREAGCTGLFVVSFCGSCCIYISYQILIPLFSGWFKILQYFFNYF